MRFWRGISICAFTYKIAVLKEIYEHQEKYGFDCHQKVTPYVNSVKETVETSTIKNLKAYAYENDMTVKQLRKLNPWLLGKSVKIAEKEQIRIVLPDLRSNVPASAYAATHHTTQLQEELAYNY